MVGVGVKAREERGGGDAGELGERREVTSNLLGAPVSLGDRTEAKTQGSHEASLETKLAASTFLINHKAANRCSSPGAPLSRPTPTPKGGGGRNKARAPRRDPGPRSRSGAEGLRAEAAPGAGGGRPRGSGSPAQRTACAWKRPPQHGSRHLA